MTLFVGTSIAIIDDHPIFRRGVVALLSDELGFDNIYQGESANDAVEIATSHNPEIMLLDQIMPGDGIAALSAIRQVAPGTHCVILTANECPDTAIKALTLGARGFILKGIGSNEMIRALEVILNGGTFVSPAFVAPLLLASQGDGSTAPPVSLTARESEVLRELETGHTNREIAEKLNIAEKTVKFYMTNIMQKLGVRNRVEAVIEFQRLRG